MLQKPDSSKKTSNTRFFHQVEALGRALAVEPNNPKPKPKPKPDSSSSSSSTWSWKNPLKSLSHIRHHRFECRFSLRVHSIVNLPPSLSTSTFVVHWRRVSDSSPGAQTRPVRALRGHAAFEETLTYTSSIYATRSGGPHRQAKYESRHFLLYPALAGATGFDLGKHQVDLTSILPVTLEELKGDKVSGEWATTFRLSGKARGATLNVSFGYSLLGDRNAVPEISSPNGTTSSILRRTGSVTGTSFGGKERGRGVLSRSVEDGRALGEIIKRDRMFRQECSELVDLKPEYEAFSEPNDSPEMKCCTSSVEQAGDDRGDEAKFTVIVQGVEIPKGSQVDADRLGSLSKNLSNLEFEGSQMSYDEVGPNCRAADMRSKSLNFDDIAESVTNEFLAMLGLEDGTSEVFSGSDPESPRASLWKEFEKESLMVSDPIFGYEDFSEDFDLSSIVQAAEMELLEESSTAESKSRAQMLEDAETEALMQKWGMNKKVFENSPPGISNGFGSPIHLPQEEQVELPPLGENLGPVVQTKDGGFLRSMSPSLFKNSKINGSLVMQSSNPVVMPAEMGSDVVEILQGLASVGIEKLSMQASKLMPLEDVTGRSMQQLAWEAAPALDTCERHDDLQENNLYGKSSISLRTSDRIRKGECLNLGSSKNGEAGSEYVSLEDLAPLAMDKIEALSIEGLRIQSGLSDEEAPSNINPGSLGEVSAFEGNGAKNWKSLGLEGAAGLQLLDVKDDGKNVDGLMGLTITLDEWMRLDSGVIDEEDQISERTSKVLAAHHAKSAEFLTADKRGGKRSGRRRGLLGNNFTVALMVQLRDPLRDYEPVGTPMLALIQVERVFIPPKPRIYSTVPEKGNNEQDNEIDTNPVPLTKGETKVEEDAIPQFKIAEVHVAGLKTESGKQKLWGNSKQQHQSGSRWLLANGMGKSNKNPFMKSSVTTKPSHMATNVQPGDNLWSISSRAHGNGAKWKGLAASNHQIRNPNVNFPNKNIRLR